MADTRSILTRAGYEQLVRELEELEENGRAAAREKLNDTSDDTNIAEEGAFHEAVRDQAILEARITTLRRTIGEAQIVDEDPDPSTASPGDRVIVRDLDTREEFTFDLLGGPEIAHGRPGVSIESPVGRALLGKRAGETIEVDVPDGHVRYEVLRLEVIPPASRP